jgi:hypothetical protein
MDDWIASPVDEGAQDAAITKERQDGLHPGQIESEELGVRHFARRHSELAMRAAGYMT